MKNNPTKTKQNLHNIQFVPHREQYSMLSNKYEESLVTRCVKTLYLLIAGDSVERFGVYVEKQILRIKRNILRDVYRFFHLLKFCFSARIK